MSTSTEIATQTAYLRVVLSEPTDFPSLGGFSERFRDLEDLLFVSALIALAQPATNAGVILWNIAFDVGPESPWETGLPPGMPLPLPPPPPPGISLDDLFSREAIDAAEEIVAGFRVVEVAYASPIDILMILVENAADNSGPIAIGSGLVLSAAGALIHLWKKFSDARDSSAEADITEAQARIMTAQAREAEARAKVSESEAALRIEGHQMIREHLGITRSKHGPDSPMSNRTGPGPDPVKSTKALDKRLDRAVQALITIEDAEIERA